MDHAPAPHPVVLAIAKITRRRAADIQGHLSLATLGLSSSFGLGALRSRMEQQNGVRLPPLDVQMTVGQVTDLFNGGTLPAARGGAPAAMEDAAPVAAGVAAPMTLSGIGLGMDMQEIDTFPLVSDYRADPFYAAHFDATEIATALLRPDARTHLCGVFCAKEAAKKSHPALLDLRMSELRVNHDQAGRPSLHVKQSAGVADPFTFLITITHTERTAAATCLTLTGSSGGGQFGA